MKCAKPLFWIILIFFSCGEKENPTLGDNYLFQALANGEWSISYFEIRGVNRTQEFEGVNFMFLPNGQMEGYLGTRLLSQGTWSTRVDSGRRKLRLSLSQFEELNGEWFQDFIKPSQVKLRKDDKNSEAFLFLERF